MKRCFCIFLSFVSHRLAVWDDLPVELVHGHEGGGVIVEVDETVRRRLARELVLDHLSEEQRTE